MGSFEDSSVYVFQVELVVFLQISIYFILPRRPFRFALTTMITALRLYSVLFFFFSLIRKYTCSRRAAGRGLTMNF